MMKIKSTKRALLGSALALLVCVSMLVGSTFAWFTDSVTSAGNKIQAGTLNIDMLVMDENGDYQSVKTNQTPIFTDDVLWEPGYAEWRNIKVSTTGNLALKYQMNIAMVGASSALADVIDVYYAASKIAKPQSLSLDGLTRLGTLSEIFGSNQAGALIQDTLIPGTNAEDYATIVLKMQESAGNQYQGLSIGAFDINIVATQLTYESDSFNNQYDKYAEYAYVSTPVSVPNNATEPETLKSGSPTPIETKLPAEVLNNLPDGVEEISLAHTEANIDENAKTIKFASLEIVDQNGDKVDLSNNTEPITVSFEVPFADGEIFDIYHDDELVASVVVDGGKITYEALHFCEVSVAPFDTAKGTPVTNADELVAALEKGEDVFFMNDIKIEPANMSNAYGKTGINVKNGQTIDGNGYTLNIKGAGGTWDSGINTTGGVIKNIKVTGSFRGIFINHTSNYSETVVLDNVILEGVTYTISCDQGMNQNLVATNCTFNGWTSYAATLGSAKFINCNFGEGNGYKYCRPYAPTEFVKCTFSEGYAIDETRTTVNFEDCIYN